LEHEPFRADLEVKDILRTNDLNDVKERFDYTLGLGGVGVVTGDIGSGKSTALRFCYDSLHPSEYRGIYLLATTGSILELYRQIMMSLGIGQSGNSRAKMTQAIRHAVRELICVKKMKTVLIIDEASLLRLEVLAELHTLTQFDQDSKGWFPVILAGQTTIVDKLMFRNSEPLASRVVSRSHLEGLDIGGMENYLSHHLKLAGLKSNPFVENAVIAIHQGSGGLLRKANHLARGALIAAARDKSTTVLAEHVRIASTELI